MCSWPSTHRRRQNQSSITVDVSKRSARLPAPKQISRTSPPPGLDRPRKARRGQRTTSIAATRASARVRRRRRAVRGGSVRGEDRPGLVDCAGAPSRAGRAQRVHVDLDTDADQGCWPGLARLLVVSRTELPPAVDRTRVHTLGYVDAESESMSAYAHRGAGSPRRAPSKEHVPPANHEMNCAPKTGSGEYPRLSGRHGTAGDNRSRTALTARISVRVERCETPRDVASPVNSATLVGQQCGRY
ncbi:hypothetical protein C8Q76DRAFT_732893 [Earliella scabrosa]|nr:hypothetical protein C8Q76DRAFT_732893 [Earliella scabrosa]